MKKLENLNGEIKDILGNPLGQPPITYKVALVNIIGGSLPQNGVQGVLLKQLAELLWKEEKEFIMDENMEQLIRFVIDQNPPRYPVMVIGSLIEYLENAPIQNA